MRSGVVLSLALVLATVAGCSDKNNNQLGTAQGTLRMELTDAPAAFDAVRLVVREVAARRAGSDTTSGWEVLRTDSATFQQWTFVSPSSPAFPGGLSATALSTSRRAP